MSCSWDTPQSSNRGITVDPLYLNFQPYPDETQCLSNDQLQLLFNSTQDHANTDNSVPTWEWPVEDLNLLPYQTAGEEEAIPQTAVEDQTPQEIEHDMRHAVSALQHKTDELEERMESRFAQVEEKYANLWNG